MEKREEEGRQSCQELGAIRDAWSGDKGIFPAGGCERVLAVGTEWQGNSYLCDTDVSLLDRWLDQEGSCPRGTQLLSISHQGVHFIELGSTLCFCQGKK